MFGINSLKFGIAAIVFITLVGCKARETEDSSNLQGLNRGEEMNEDSGTFDAMMEGRKVVVIFYANDTYATRSDDPAESNKDALADFLKSSASKEKDEKVKAALNELGKKVENDWNLFRTIIGQNVDVLRNQLCANVGSNYYESVGGLAVFRNYGNDASIRSSAYGDSEYLRKMKWESCVPGDTFFTGHTLEVPRIHEFPYESQPYSHELVFQKALESVRNTFNPEKYRYILITKSHGSDEMAIAPHLSVDLRSMIKSEPQKILAAFKKKDAKSTSVLGLDPFKQAPFLDEVDGAVREAVNAKAKGVSKAKYLRILNQLGSGGPSNAMNFPIVLMESCRSDLRFSSDSEIEWVLNYYPAKSYAGFNMRNVAYMFTSDEDGLAYTDINYHELMGFRYNSYTDFQKIFKAFLDGKSQKGK